MSDFIRDPLAYIDRELALMDVHDEALRLAPASSRRKSGTSIVFSVRLDPAEVAALETRAAVVGIRPTVLARNLLRTGLVTRHGGEVAAAVDRLEAAVNELRSLVP